MYKVEDKVYFTWEDFEDSIDFLRNDLFDKDIHIVTLYRGGLPLGVRLSNEFNLPLTILDYQTYDGTSSEVTMMKNAGITSNQTIFLVDDIADTGNSIRKSIKFLYKEFPNNPVKVFTLMGNDEKNPKEWMYYHKHRGEWVEFPHEMNTTEQKLCLHCIHGESCYKDNHKTHCRLFDKSFDDYHYCKEFEFNN